MIRYLLAELYLNLKRPFFVGLLIIHALIIGIFIYHNNKVVDSIKGVYDTEFRTHASGLKFEMQLAEYNQIQDIDIFEDAINLNVDVYTCRTNNSTEKDCYEKEIAFREKMITLKKEYNYRYSSSSVFQLDREIQEYKALITKDMNYHLDEEMSAIHFFVQYYETYFYLILIILGIIVGSFSISENYNQGNIKTIASLPISRTKIISSKIICVCITSFLISYIPIFIFTIILSFFNFGEVGYPYIIYKDYSWIEIPELNVYVGYLFYSVLICILMTIVGFVFSYIFKDGIKALLASILSIVFPYILINASGIFNRFIHLSFTSYLKINDVLNGNLIKESQNIDLNIYLATGIMSLLILLFIILLIYDFKKKDLDTN